MRTKPAEAPEVRSDEAEHSREQQERRRILVIVDRRAVLDARAVRIAVGSVCGSDRASLRRRRARRSLSSRRSSTDETHECDGGIGPSGDGVHVVRVGSMINGTSQASCAPTPGSRARTACERLPAAATSTANPGRRTIIAVVPAAAPNRRRPWRAPCHRGCQR